MNTVIEKMSQKGVIAIKPYLTGTPNMGLELYDLVIHPGATQSENITCIEKNGVKRYLTGLDEYAPEVRAIKDDNLRKARIKDIRETVIYLEEILESNTTLKVDDEDFWSKVKLLKPNNSEFWDKIEIKCGNEDIRLNPKVDAFDLIKIKAIEAGGFTLVAKSFDDAKAANKPPMFYLDRQIDTVRTKTEGKKLRNKALGLLDEVYAKDRAKFMYICKLTDAHSHQYKLSTPLDVMYDNMDNFINGLGVEKKPVKAAELFIKNATAYDMQTLKLKALCKDATFFKNIHLKGDGMFYHMNTNTLLGRNLDEVVEFFANPVNEDILDSLLGEIEKMWNE